MSDNNQSVVSASFGHTERQASNQETSYQSDKQAAEDSQAITQSFI